MAQPATAKRRQAAALQSGRAGGGARRSQSGCRSQVHPWFDQRPGRRPPGAGGAALPPEPSPFHTFTASRRARGHEAPHQKLTRRAAPSLYVLVCPTPQVYSAPTLAQVVFQRCLPGATAGLPSSATPRRPPLSDPRPRRGRGTKPKVAAQRLPWVAMRARTTPTGLRPIPVAPLWPGSPSARLRNPFRVADSSRSLFPG